MRYKVLLEYAMIIVYSSLVYRESGVSGAIIVGVTRVLDKTLVSDPFLFFIYLFALSMSGQTDKVSSVVFNGTRN